MKCRVMPSQTIGPFPHEAWRWAVDANATAGGAAVEIAGRVLDGAGAPVDDAWLEFWSAAAVEPALAVLAPGFRRAATGPDGGYRIAFPTLAPAADPAIYVTLFSRGILTHLHTALLLEDAPGLDRSRLLQQVPAARRATLIARKAGAAAYRWDVHLQGEQETVFFDYGQATA